MAVEDLILGVTEQDGPPPNLSAIVTHQKLGRLGPGTGSVLAGTPVYRSESGRYRPWQYGEKIHAFVLAVVALDSVKDTFADLMLRGEIEYADVVLPAGQLQVDLDAALRRLREAGISVNGLTDSDSPSPDSTLNPLAPSFIAAGSTVFNPTLTQI